MKKITLSIIAIMLSMMATAQAPFVKMQGSSTRFKPVGYQELPDRLGQNDPKTTIASPRWYVPFSVYNALYSNALLNFSQGLNLWQDSTMLQVYTTGASPVDYASVIQVIDPISTPVLFNNPLFFGNAMQIGSGDSYKVDSVLVQGIYVRNPNRPQSVVDTLIISVAPNRTYYYWLKTNSLNSWAIPYLPANKDTLSLSAASLIDSVERAIFPDTMSRAFWKVPLTSTMGTNNFAQNFIFGVPNGGLTIPAGHKVGVSVTFKSGDHWQANQDTISNFHQFLPVTGEISIGQRMPYLFYSHGDRNSTGYLFTKFPNFNYPSLLVEALNSAAFQDEYAAIGVKISCASCNTLSVAETDKGPSALSIYPNPAKNDVTIKMHDLLTGMVEIRLVDAMGRIAYRQDVQLSGKNSVITVPVNNVVNGLYFVQVISEKKSYTGTLTIAH